MFRHGILSALLSDIHPTSQPNVPIPQKNSSIIRLEPIAMHFTAEIWETLSLNFNLMPAPPACAHTSPTLTSMRHFPRGLHEWPVGDLLTSPPWGLHFTPPHTNNWLIGSETLQYIQTHWRVEGIQRISPEPHTHAFNSKQAETESTWHTILLVYLAINSSTLTVWNVVQGLWLLVYK